jgi:L-lactate dehydrogenase complex protein LldF
MQYRISALRSDKAEILYCIRCGACLNACPVYANIGGHSYGSVYSGPIGSVVSPILGGTSLYADLPHASTLCGACHDACPVRIDLPTLLLRLRRDSVQQGISPTWQKAAMKGYEIAATRPKLFGSLTQLANIFSRLTGRHWLSWLPGPLSGWTRFRKFPPFFNSFQNQQRSRQDE